MDSVMYKKFLEIFSDQELQSLIDISDIVSDNLICINTDKYFFEISSVEIYAIENSGKSKIISKEKLFKLLKREPTVSLDKINVN